MIAKFNVSEVIYWYIKFEFVEFASEYILLIRNYTRAEALLDKCIEHENRRVCLAESDSEFKEKSFVCVLRYDRVFNQRLVRLKSRGIVLKGNEVI